MAVVAVSGGFTWLHAGHVRMIKEARKHGDVIVILNSDEWQKRKYGKIVMPYDQRAEVMHGVKGVLDVIPADDADGTVCKTLAKLRPDYFANGGDRTTDNTPELTLCCDLGIKTLFNVGGGKANSSSELIRTLEPDEEEFYAELNKMMGTYD